MLMVFGSTSDFACNWTYCTKTMKNVALKKKKTLGKNGYANYKIQFIQ